MAQKFDPKTEAQICLTARIGMGNADTEVARAERDLRQIQQKGARELFTSTIYVGKQKQALFARLIRNHCHDDESSQQRPDSE